MFGYISKKVHDQVLADKDARIAGLMTEVAKTGVLLIAAQRDRDEARAKLAPLVTARERSLQNLRDANARRKAKAAPVAEEV